MRKVFLTILVAVLSLAGCQRDPAPLSRNGAQQAERPGAEVNKVLKVKVTAGGDITADGQPVTLEQLTARLAELKLAGGGVWYHRENAAGEPHPNAMKVIELVAQNKLPVRLSANPDFSDAVDEKGVSHPSGQ
jgi:biopolymer transport protein ExbD